MVDLELTSIGNFHVCANSKNGEMALEDAWEAPIQYLPNLYFLDDTVQDMRRKWNGGTLRIGAFGALRPLKNVTGSAFAALSIATSLATNVEFHVNTGRVNQGGGTALESVRAIYRDLPYAKVVEWPWTNWPNFRRIVRSMHLLLQPSFTESFNMVTADGVAEGIASVTSDVIEWVPDWWKAPPDNTNAIARTGRMLLMDGNSGRDGLRALTDHNESGSDVWIKYLTKKGV